MTRGRAAVRPRTICLHGVESTGKTWLAQRLARHFGSLWVPEFGRLWCEAFGTDVDMAGLVAIGRLQDSMTQLALGLGRDPLILDTDPLMTAVWCDMMMGTRDPWFAAWHRTAGLYLLLDIDIPWQPDGLRIFGADADRQRFHALAAEELDRRGVNWALVRGEGEARFEAALAAIEAAGLGGSTMPQRVPIHGA